MNTLKPSYPQDDSLNLQNMNQLWEKYHQEKTEALKEELILLYLPWVKRIAQKALPFNTNAISIKDLVSIGLLQLNQAIEKYSPQKNNSFKNFAYMRIYGAMIDELRSMDQFPRSLRDKAKKIQKHYIQLIQSGVDPNDEDMANALSVTTQQYWHMIQSFPPSLLPFFLQKNQPATFINDSSYTPADPSTPFTHFSKSEHKEMILKVLQDLPEKSRMVLILYYYRELTLKEIGKILSLSESRICQIHNQAIFKMKACLASSDGIESYATY